MYKDKDKVMSTQRWGMLNIHILRFRMRRLRLDTTLTETEEESDEKVLL